MHMNAIRRCVGVSPILREAPVREWLRAAAKVGFDQLDMRLRPSRDRVIIVPRPVRIVLPHADVREPSTRTLNVDISASG
jgi:hypothetical protein